MTIDSRYRVINMIGTGGMGAVYRVFDRLTADTLALKQVTLANHTSPDGSPQTSDFHIALAREFRTLASMRHPNIISVVDYGFGMALDGSNQRQPYYTMELLDAPQTIIEAGQGLDTAGKVELIRQTLQALAYLHRREVIHRDIKPDNILVVTHAAQPTVKVVDFGLSAHSAMLNGDKRIAGTLHYMAPEVLRQQVATEASDLWAIGVLMYMLFTGEHPFATQSNARTIRNIISAPVALDRLAVEQPIKAVLTRLLEKDPTKRFTDAQVALYQLSHMGGRATPLETSSIRESYLRAANFVGREQEMAHLSTALTNALDGRGSAWLIGGEAGVGKSRLVEELKVRALVKGALVISGEATPEGATPYEAWRDVLRPLIIAVELTDTQASVLKPIVPDIDTLLDRPVTPPPEIDMQAAQSRLLMVVEALFEAYTGPIVMVLEDLHWASESLAILDRMSRYATLNPILIIGTYRDEERPGLPADLPDMQTLPLDRLDRPHVTALVTSILGERPQREAMIDLIMRETEGNILFVIEVLRALAEERGGLADVDDGPLPETVLAGGIEQILRNRLQRIPQGERSLLDAAAIAGREIDLRLLEQIAPEHNITRWLTVCLNANVLTVQEGRPRFAHEKIREAITSDLPTAHRRNLHKKVASAIEQLYLTDPSKALVLAYHWGEAANVSKEAAYAALGGQQAILNGAHKDAKRLFKRAADLAEAVNTPPVQRAIFELRVGEAAYALGDMAEGAAHLRQALDYLKVPTPDSTLNALLRTGGQLLKQIKHRLFGLPDVTDPEAAHANATAARICTHLTVYNFYRVNREHAIYYMLQGLNLSEEAGRFGMAERISLYASHSVGLGALNLYRMAERYVQLADAAAEETTDADALTGRHLAIATYRISRGEWQDANRRLTEVLDMATTQDLTRRVLDALERLFDSAYLRGELERAGLYNTRMQMALERTANKQYQAVQAIEYAARLMRTGIYDDALELLQQTAPTLGSIEDRSHLIWSYGLQAQIYARRKDIDGLLLMDDLLQEAIGEQGPTSYWLLDGYAGYAEGALTLWADSPTAPTQHRAKRALKALRRFANSHDIGKPRALSLKAWAAQLEGRPQQAQRLAREAIHQAEALNMAYDKGLAMFRLAQLLPAKSAEGHALLRQAATDLRAIGAFGEVERIGAYIGLEDAP